MFGKNTFINNSDLYNYEIWDDYMGQLWAFLFEQTDFKKDNSVLEIAPGATPKIAKALGKLGFCGFYFIVEPHDVVSNIIYKKTKELIPKANVILLKQEFNEVESAGDINYIVANHPFDDFITSYVANLMDRNTLFQDISQNSHESLIKLRSIWEHLSLQPLLLKSVENKILSDFKNLICRLNPDKIILSQYKASYFKNNNLDIINIEAYNLFNGIRLENYHKIDSYIIQNVLNKNENYNDSWIGNNILDANNWRIYEKK